MRARERERENPNQQRRPGLRRNQPDIATDRRSLRKSYGFSASGESEGVIFFLCEAVCSWIRCMIFRSVGAFSRNVIRKRPGLGTREEIEREREMGIITRARGLQAANTLLTHSHAHSPSPSPSRLTLRLPRAMCMYVPLYWPLSQPAGRPLINQSIIDLSISSGRRVGAAHNSHMAGNQRGSCSDTIR